MEHRLPTVAWPKVRLDSVATVQTGIAKGAKVLRDPISLPYVRVANVQDGRLDLSKMKSIEIERAQLQRYALRRGDVLMTEGGDFDKLGRGSIWAGEIEPCLHQNHVFAIRCDRDRLLPEWLSWVSGSHYGRRYFTLCSKQSTNLASINSSQLKAFPLPLPSIFEQQKIATALRALDARALLLLKLVNEKRRLKRSLMQQLLAGQRRFPEFADSPWAIHSLIVPAPPIAEQQRIVEILEILDHQIGLLEAQRRQFEQYKRALLSRLLSGEIAVPA